MGGQISYALYLIHMPVTSLIVLIVNGRPTSYDTLADWMAVHNCTPVEDFGDDWEKTLWEQDNWDDRCRRIRGRELYGNKMLELKYSPIALLAPIPIAWLLTYAFEKPLSNWMRKTCCTGERKPGKPNTTDEELLSTSIQNDQVGMAGSAE